MCWIHTLKHIKISVTTITYIPWASSKSNFYQWFKCGQVSPTLSSQNASSHCIVVLYQSWWLKCRVKHWKIMQFWFVCFLFVIILWLLWQKKNEFDTIQNLKSKRTYSYGNLNPFKLASLYCTHLYQQSCHCWKHF